MDQSRFQEAQQAYQAGDYRLAAKGFLASASRGPEGNGAAYHMAGNALMRLRRYQDAVTVYGHALRDPLYDRRGAVQSNLGAAFCELGEYTEAARAYESALQEVDYTTPYKAYQGMAGALLERGRVEDAAIAYRKAALDPGNPDPGKALVNLGLCFMGLGRPADAVEAYRAALGFDDYKGRGKALANLGLAFMALGNDEEAVRSFEKATELHNHKLSAAAGAAYSMALANTRPADADAALQVTAEQLPVTPAPGAGQPAPLAAPAPDAAAAPEPAPAPDAAPAPEPGDAAPSPVHAEAHAFFDAEQELPAEVPAAPEAVAEPSSPGLTGTWTDALVTPVEPLDTAMGEPLAVALSEDPGIDFTQPLAPFDHPHGAEDLGIGEEEAVADFFSATDEELKARDKEARRAARHARGPWAVWRKVIAVAVVLVVVVGALVAAYQLGYGWPTQSQTVGGLLSAFESGSAFDGYWVAAPSKDITKEMAKIPPVKSYTIDGVSMGPTTSQVAVTVTPKNGAPLHYTITLSREGVGWKVSGVDNDWSTTGG